MQQDHISALPSNNYTTAGTNGGTAASFYSLFAGADDPFAGLDAVGSSTASARPAPPALPPKPGRVPMSAAGDAGVAAGGQTEVAPARLAAVSAAAGLFVAARELLPDDSDNVAGRNGRGGAASFGGASGVVGVPAAALDVARVAPWAAYQPQGGQPTIPSGRRAGPPGVWEPQVSAASSVPPAVAAAPRSDKGSNGGSAAGRLAVRDFDKARAFEALLAGDGFDGGAGVGGGGSAASTVRLTSTPAVAAGPPAFDTPTGTGAAGLVRSRSVVSTASSDASGSVHGGRRVLGGLLKLGSARSGSSGPRSAGLPSAGLDSNGVFVDTDAPPVPVVPARARLVAKDASTAGSSGTARELAEFLRATRIESVDGAPRAAGAAAADGAAVRAASAVRPRLVAKDAAGGGGNGGRDLAEFLRSTGPDPQPTTMATARGREASYDGSGGRASRRGRLASVSAGRAAGASAGAAAVTAESMPTAMVVPAPALVPTATAADRREVWIQTDEKLWSESSSQASFPLATSTLEAAVQTDELEEKFAGDGFGWAGVVVAGGRRAAADSGDVGVSGGARQRPRLGSSPEPPVATTTTGMFVGRLGRRASEVVSAVSGSHGAVVRR
ncbi:hypothetical protein HK405_008947, partial [Cladochytrium tenue]